MEMDIACSMDLNVQHRYRHAALEIDMDMQHGYAEYTSSMNMCIDY
jgi:hypothetical protein